MLYRMIKTLGALLLLLAVTLGIYIALNSRDIPPPDVSDLHVPYPEVPDEQNAYVVFREVLSTFKLSEEQREIIYQNDPEEFPSVERLQMVLDSHDDALDMIRNACGLPHCVFPRPENIDTAIPELSGLLTIGKILQMEGQVALKHGQVKEAIVAAQTLYALGDALSATPETMIQHLVGMALTAHAYHLTERIIQAPDLEHDGVTVLISLVEASLDLEDDYAHAMKTEVRFVELSLKSVSLEKDQILEELGWRRFFRFLPGSYMFKPNQVLSDFADYTRLCLKKLGKPVSEIVYKVDEVEPLLSLEGIKISPNFLGRYVMSILMPSFEQIHIKTMSAVTEGKALRLLLELRSFENIHERLPSARRELLNGDTDSLFSDPFDGEPLRYDPVGKIIWSVGEDLIDQNGSTALRAGESQWRRDDRRYTEDMVWEMAW